MNPPITPSQLIALEDYNNAQKCLDDLGVQRGNLNLVGRIYRLYAKMEQGLLPHEEDDHK